MEALMKKIGEKVDYARINGDKMEKKARKNGEKRRKNGEKVD
jgi:hypothetical protein